MAPKGPATRPTADRVRESLFSILGAPPDDLSVLDLFAGAGTLGLEALSRGADRAVFVESAKPAVTILRKNIASLDLADRCAVQIGRLPSALSKGHAGRGGFDWVFCDPPYDSDLATEVLSTLAGASLLSASLLSDEAIVVVEHDRRIAPASEVGCLVRTDRRRYGDTEISFYRRGPT